MKQKFRTKSIFCLSRGLFVNSSAACGVQYIAVVRSCALYSAGVEPERFAIASIALSAAGPGVDIVCMTSYHAPVSASAKPGFFSIVFVLTTSRSRISSGVCDESKIRFTPGVCSIFSTIGFHVTTARAFLSAMNAGAMSASDVLTIFTADSSRPAVSSARASR